MLKGKVSSSSVDVLDTIVKVDTGDRNLNQASVFGDYYKGSSAGGTGNDDTGWCNVNAQASRGPHVQSTTDCEAAFGAFNDSDFEYLGTIDVNSNSETLQKFFGDTANNQDVEKYPNGCYMRDGNSRRILNNHNGGSGGGNPNADTSGKYFAFIANDNAQPDGNASIKPVCKKHVCVTSANPCQNSASCDRVSAEEYTCSCTGNFIGTNCNIVDVCKTNNPCKNGNACVTDPDDGSATCQCNVSTCGDNGTCNDTDGTCTCADGYEGTNCETQTTPAPTAAVSKAYLRLEKYWYT